MKYTWKYGESDQQKYYEANANGTYLCVFSNSWNPDTWMAMIKNKCISVRNRAITALQILKNHI